MTINNPEAYCKGIWDWGILRGCFGATRIEPTDIDGHVERNGLFLWLETKRSGASIPEGQLITFKKLADRGDTIMIIWGDTNKPEELLIIYPGGEQRRIHADIEVLRERVSAWFNWANGART